MNFDDLHDPDPPRPGMGALAAVAGRARQIRRRRAALVTAGGVLAALAVVVPTALVVTGDNPGDRLTSATMPDVPTAPTGTTLPPAPPSTSGSTTSTSTTSATTTTTTLPPLEVPALVAIQADGDVVLIDGAETLVYDGADPRAQPSEGELTIVDSVVVTPDGRVFVSTCCEPVPGAYLEIAVGSGPIEASLVYGHGLEVSPDGTRLLSVGAGGITVAGLDGDTLASVSLDGSLVYRQPESAMWLGDDAVAVIELRQPGTGNEFRLFTTDGELTDVETAEGVVIGTDPDAPWPAVAGVGADGSILVFQGAGDPATATALHAYDPATLERVSSADVALPAPATFAWFEDGVLIWVGTGGDLHVGDTVVDGEYRWARRSR